jgi:hypothetical protein
LHFEEGERDLLVTRLGLADDADDAAVAAAVAQWMQEEPSSGSGGTSTDDSTNANANLDDLGENQGDFVVVDVASFRRLQQRDQVAATVEETMRRRDRDELIAEAVHDGKISPSRADHYKNRYDSDPEGTTALMARLTPNTVPLEERGADTPTDQVDDTAYPKDWVPEVAARAARPPSRVHGEA